MTRSELKSSEMSHLNFHGKNYIQSVCVANVIKYLNFRAKKWTKLHCTYFLALMFVKKLEKILLSKCITKLQNETFIVIFKPVWET